MKGKNYGGGRNRQPVQILPQTNRVYHVRLKITLQCRANDSSDSYNHPNLQWKHNPCDERRPP